MLHSVEKQIAEMALKMADNKEHETVIMMECIFELARAIDTLNASTKKILFSAPESATEKQS